MTHLLHQAINLGVEPFRVHLAHHLYTRYTPHCDEDIFWLLIHVAEQAGTGHLRTNLNRIAEEASMWTAENEELPTRLQDRSSKLVATAIEKGLISQLHGENSRADSVSIPRPPLLLTSDATHLYFLRRRREEDEFLAMIDERSQSGAIIGGTGDDRPEDTLYSMISAGKRLLLLTGGPGTGKTTTVARLLKKFAPSLRVLLTAPTGRAASRMAESIPGHHGRTLHGVLGIVPGRLPKHNPKNPLSADIVVVDEASMVDLTLMNTLLRALAPHTALLLVGDPEQLPSVGAGAILGDLLHGTRQAALEAGGGPLSDSVVQLTRVYRSNTSIIEAATAIRNGNLERLHAAADGTAISIIPLTTVDAVTAVLAEEYRYVRGTLDAFTALTPLRRGRWGVAALNENISGLMGPSSSLFPGMPIVITRNDASRLLWNGDRAQIEQFGDNFRAVLQHPEGNRALPLAVLPGWEAAWVQTIHKSQGSEFNAIAVILPDNAERLLSREILYTALTRARHRVSIYANDETLHTALQRQVVRHSRIRHWAAGKTRECKPLPKKSC